MRYRRKGLFVEATEDKDTGEMVISNADGSETRMKREQFDGTYEPDEAAPKSKKKS